MADEAPASEQSASHEEAPSEESAELPSAAASLNDSLSEATPRDYVLTIEGPRGKHRQELSLTPHAMGLRVSSPGREPWDLQQDGHGSLTASNEGQVLPELAAILEQAGERRVTLPGGGWLEVKQQSEPLASKAGPAHPLLARRVLAKVRGRLASGERFTGKVRADLHFDPRDRGLVSLRAREDLDFEHRGRERFELNLAPPAQGAPALPKASQEKRVGWAPSARPGEVAAAAAFGFAALLSLLFVTLAKALGGGRLLCLVLAAALIVLPLGRQAEAKSWWQRLDPTSNEIALTIVGVLVTGTAAAVAAVTAPAWVPVAIAAAGVTAIGAYWATRKQPIRKGEIIARRHEPERTYLTYVAVPHTTVVSDGKTTTTNTTIVMTPMWVHDDEDFVIKIAGGEDQTRTLYLDAEQYAQTALGQHYDMDAQGGSADDANEKRKATSAEQARLDAAKSEGREEIDLSQQEGATEALQRAR
ncbi:MAG TPA: hypothetical protein DEA08_22295 [Planctomycetes bacterium]|nr:hypothetical protein [Planctomycetota bacterium]